jgi:hypothetical protein
LGELTVIGGVTISGAILIAGSFSNPRQLLAQAVKAALVRDQVDYVAVSGAAASTGGNI